MKRTTLLVFLFFSFLFSACGKPIIKGQIRFLEDGSLVKAAVDLSVNSNACTTQGDQQVVIVKTPWDGEGEEEGRFMGEDHIWVMSLAGNFTCEEGTDSLSGGWTFPKNIK